MKRRIISIILGTLVYWICSPSTAGAQRHAPYAPYRPTISPYFNYFRSDTGGIPAYYQFVRPSFDYQRHVQQQATGNQQQTGRVQNLELQVQGLMAGQPTSPVKQRPLQSHRRPGQQIPSFQNYSHFYPPKSVPKARQAFQPSAGGTSHQRFP